MTVIEDDPIGRSLDGDLFDYSGQLSVCVPYTPFTNELCHELPSSASVRGIELVGNSSIYRED